MSLVLSEVELATELSPMLLIHILYHIKVQFMAFQTNLKLTFSFGFPTITVCLQYVVTKTTQNKTKEYSQC